MIPDLAADLAADPARDPAQIFAAHRGRVFGLAYRMLGSVGEAEDVVQDAFLRWLAADRAEVTRPGAWLATAATRLCLDRLRAARRARALYAGPWLPDPLADPPDPAPGPAEVAERAETVSLALMLALDRLTPLERAAFLLHDVFGTGFAEIAEIAAALGRSEPACRQLAARARASLRDARPRAAPPPDETARVADAFFAALRTGDPAGLAALLAEDAALVADGGGNARAALNPILGGPRIARFFAGLARKRGAAPPLATRRLALNGLPGQLALGADGLLMTVSVEVADGRVAAVWITRNPDKLAHLRGALPVPLP